jgi:hypothetical protein
MARLFVPETLRQRNAPFAWAIGCWSIRAEGIGKRVASPYRNHVPHQLRQSGVP